VQRNPFVSTLNLRTLQHFLITVFHPALSHWKPSRWSIPGECWQVLIPSLMRCRQFLR
jgi:hypothetical protein